MKIKSSQHGFTLIELSIVLVIIGLVVGGVLVGRDMIKAAELRATITQIERYDTTVNSFRDKYNGLPGDLSNCARFFVAASCPPTGGAGNGSLDDNVLTASGPVRISGEVAAFFNQLYLAKMIAEPMTDTTNITGVIGAPTVNNLWPAAKMSGRNYILVYTGGQAITYPGMARANLYRITGVTVNANAIPTFANALTPSEAFAMDSKRDDGRPNTGIVQGNDSIGGFNSAFDQANTAYAANTCLASATAYNTLLSPDVKLCQVMIRASF